jgi:2-octaprenyl-6-methoxyphenol hydroxylase
MADKFDVVVIGGSYIGMATSIMLAEIGLKVALIERKKLGNYLNESGPSRLLAISKASQDILARHSLHLDFEEMGQAINYIKVTDDKSSASLEFDPTELNLISFGHMVESKILLHNMYNKLLESGVTLLEEYKVVDLNERAPWVEVQTSKGQEQRLHCQLIVAADGRNSWVREYLQIKTNRKNYGQTALVCDVWHEKHHHGIAVEKFMKSGPFAILPKKGGHHSAIVWTQKTRTLNLKDPTLPEQIATRLGRHLGEVKVVSELGAYPLSLLHAKEYSKGKIIFLGDAIHTIHPIAGQGLNIGLRDVDCLVTLLKRNLELGAPSLTYMLGEYQSSRKQDNHVMIAATDMLNDIFARGHPIIKLIRSLGLATIDKFPPLKKQIMKYAVGYIQGV